MIDLSDLLQSFGLPTDRAVKMYRHVDRPHAIIRELQASGDIELFQAVQGSRQLGDSIVLFFAGEIGRMSRFIGGREVVSAHQFADASSNNAKAAIAKGYMGSGAIWHELQIISSLAPLEDRLAIKWPPAGRHHLWLRRPGNAALPVPVHSIRPLGFDRTFPGFDEILLRHHELHTLAVEGDGDTGWINALTSTRGVYLVTDLETGALYVGSATAAEGIWARWSTYAKTVHGNNKVMLDSVNKIEAFADRLQFSVLQTLSNLASREDGLAAERRWKSRLGKKAIILNGN
jgi:hypothetical protein